MIKADKNFLSVEIPDYNIKFDSGKMHCFNFDSTKGNSFIYKFGAFTCQQYKPQKFESEESGTAKLTATASLKHPWFLIVLLSIGISGLYWGWLKLLREIIKWIW